MSTVAAALRPDSNEAQPGRLTPRLWPARTRATERARRRVATLATDSRRAPHSRQGDWMPTSGAYLETYIPSHSVHQSRPDSIAVLGMTLVSRETHTQQPQDRPISSACPHDPNWQPPQADHHVLVSASGQPIRQRTQTRGTQASTRGENIERDRLTQLSRPSHRIGTTGGPTGGRPRWRKA
jgi:hypothetical protein